MGLPVVTRLVINARAAFSRTFFVYGAGRGIDFTGCTAVLALRIVPDDATPLLRITTTPNAEGSIVLGTPTNALGPGAVEINFTPLATTGLDVATVAHGDLLVTWSDGSGPFEVMTVDAFIEMGSTY